MALTKVVYTDGETVIGAQNLNDIQDAIIENAQNIGEGSEALTEEEKARAEADEELAKKIDAAGKVDTVNNIAPDEDKNISLAAGDIPYGESNVGEALNQSSEAIVALQAEIAELKKLVS